MQFPRFSLSIPEFIFYRNKNEFYFIHVFSDSAGVDYTLIENLFSSLHKSDYQQGNSNPVLIKEVDTISNEQKEIWINKIDKGKEKFKNGELKKFVLSRKKEFNLSGKPDFYKIVDQLKTTYPNCFIFLDKVNEKTFFGASPESFIKSINDEFIFEAVAGSVPRGNHIDEEL